MAKRVEDIVPQDKRSIRNISLDEIRPSDGKPTRSSRKKDEVVRRERPSKSEEAKKEAVSSKASAKQEKEVETEGEPISIKRMAMTGLADAPKKRKKNRSYKTLLISSGIVLAVVVLGYLASRQLSSATYTIIPKSHDVTVNNSILAKYAATNGDLAYDLVSADGVASTTVAATDGPAISKKAEGKLTLLNAYSATPQRLIAGTRLIDSNSHIYRTTASVLIPGYTGSGASSPGVATVSIIADEAGDAYNVNRTSGDTFKVYLYKGTAKYDSIYGKLATDIAGGFVGKKKTVSQSVASTTSAALLAELNTNLRDKIKSAVPADYVLFDGAQVLEVSSMQTGEGGVSKASMTVKGTLYGIIFKKSAIVAKLSGEEIVKSFGNFSYTSPGLEALKVTIANAKDILPEKHPPILFSFKGNMSLIGVVPSQEIKKKMAGLSLSESKDVLKPYAAVIESAVGKLTPPWSNMPTDIGRINFIIKSPES